MVTVAKEKGNLLSIKGLNKGEKLKQLAPIAQNS
jgi:hypothetical protein